MDEQLLLPLADLDMELFLGRSSNRKKLVQRWNELSSENGKDFEILCSYLTAREYMMLFNTDQVTVISSKFSRNKKKRLLSYMEQVIVAHVEKVHLEDLRKYQGFLSKFSLETKLEKACEFVLKLRKLR
ncbi:MAG: hypothetical protein H7A25_12925 [Leptospiraceae bacterium]|nr:hypothetical protein [Leptospiraceae bacterium]MCP5500803.1 hypothetical protein [Leptospiraceae bacterium]